MPLYESQTAYRRRVTIKARFYDEIVEALANPDVTPTGIAKLLQDQRARAAAQGRPVCDADQ